MKIARNIYLSYLKKNCISEHSIDDYNMADKREPLIEKEDSIILNKVFAALVKKDRSFLILREIYGFSYDEIAVILNCSVGQVKVGIHRAKKRFKEIYIKQNGGEFNEASM